MKILMLTDTHFLFKRIEKIKDLQLQQLDYVAQYIKDNDIDYLFMLWDFMDESVKDNVSELSQQWKFIIKLYDMRKLVKKLVIITGNHDHYDLDNHSLAFFDVIQDDKIIFANKIEPITLEENLTILPIGFNHAIEVSQQARTYAKRDESRELIYTEASKLLDDKINAIEWKENMYLIAHLATLDIIPMALHNEPVLKRKTLEKFKQSFLGHIHEIKSENNVHFIGSAGRTAINENKGHFTVYDTKTQKLQYIDNKPEIEFLRVKLDSKSDLSNYTNRDLSNSLVYLESGYDTMKFKDEIIKELNDAGVIDIKHVRNKKETKELNLNYEIEGVDSINDDFVNASFQKLVAQHVKEKYPNKQEFVIEKTTEIFNKAIAKVTGSE